MDRPVTLMTLDEAHTRYEAYAANAEDDRTFPEFTFSGWLKHKNIHITDSDEIQPVRTESLPAHPDSAIVDIARHVGPV